MSRDVRIAYLVDHPEALPTLERLFQSEWPDYYGAGGPGNARRDLLAYSNRGQLPVGVVALLGSEPCGVAALKAELPLSERGKPFGVRLPLRQRRTFP